MDQKTIDKINSIDPDLIPHEVARINQLLDSGLGFTNKPLSKGRIKKLEKIRDEYLKRLSACQKK